MLVNCKLCGSAHIIPAISNLRIRQGETGNLTEDSYSVIECEECGIQYLDPFPEVGKDYYSSGLYRTEWSPDQIIDKSYFTEFDVNHVEHLRRITANNLRGNIVADYGCGAGSFLDVISGLTKKTIGIEPDGRYYQSLRSRNHKVLRSVDDVESSSIELATNFDVIEHIEDPRTFLSSIYRALVSDGLFYCLTPNREQILLRCGPQGYRQFWYRTVHYWYFNDTSFRRLAESVGFKDVKVRFVQRYDISNFVLWLRDNKPTGLGKIEIFDDSFETAWKSNLERQGYADFLWLEATK